VSTSSAARQAGGLVRLVVLIPELGAAFMCGGCALGALVCRDRAVRPGGLAVRHRGHAVARAGTTIVPVKTWFVSPGRAAEAGDPGLTHDCCAEATALAAPLVSDWSVRAKR
jgi:hypothetical protein